MAYSANGYNFTNKSLSRVKYDLVYYEQVAFQGGDVPQGDYVPTGDESIIE